ncbi:MAG: BrxA/BrxB family bacilliredoxin [Bacteroidota bacterium]|jgi:putative YphP/YqiW family bacilliredoxin|nr:BrxA/BrxB family bacilliredoxin [Bacteroidota bacterium]
MFEKFTTQRGPMYDPAAVQHMRDELLDVGFEELLTADAVDTAVRETPGVLFVVINSVCGCAAGSARPAASLALQHARIPDRFVTVFAGMERDAVERMRVYLSGYAPSSPCMALFKDGKLSLMLQRHEIEGRTAEEIAAELTENFDILCTRPGPSIPAERFAQLEYDRTCGSKIPRLD